MQLPKNYRKLETPEKFLLRNKNSNDNKINVCTMLFKKLNKNAYLLNNKRLLVKKEPK